METLDLPVGAVVEVVVQVRDRAPRRKLTSFIGAGKRQFSSIQEVDAYVRELRDEWDH